MNTKYLYEYWKIGPNTGIRTSYAGRFIKLKGCRSVFSIPAPGFTFVVAPVLHIKVEMMSNEAFDRNFYSEGCFTATTQISVNC
jgi:hypothetical protein